MRLPLPAYDSPWAWVYDRVNLASKDNEAVACFDDLEQTGAGEVGLEVGHNAGTTSIRPLRFKHPFLENCLAATGTFSSRRIEALTYDAVAVRYLCADRHPDHDSIGEENTQSSEEIRDMVTYLQDTDPYQHHVVVHTYPPQQDEVYNPLLGGKSLLTGVSLPNA